MSASKCVTLLCVFLSVPAAVRSDTCRSLGATIVDNYKSNQSYEPFEAKVHDAIQATKVLFAAEDSSNIGNSSRKADSNSTTVGLESILKGLNAVSPILQEGLSIRSEWEQNYAKAILSNLSESKRNEAESLIPLIEGKLETLLVKPKQLNETQSPEEQKKLVQALDTELNELVGIFKQDRVILREFPLLANKAVISLGLYVPIVRLYEKAVDPELYNSSQLPCNLQEVLKQYGYLTTRDRLQNLDTSDHPLVDNFKFSIWEVCYSDPTPRSNCKDKYGTCEVEMTDIVQDHNKVYGDLNSLVKKTCLHHSSPSGFGWIIVEVGALSGDFDSNSPTVKIMVDGAKQYEMTKKDGALKQNDMVFKSEKIRNTSSIVAEVWGSEKQILSVPLEFSNRYYSSKKEGNEFSLSSFWIPENVYHHHQHHHHH